MNYLVVDRGNTQTKLAFFCHSELKEEISVDGLIGEQSAVDDFIGGRYFDAAIVSSSADDARQLCQHIERLGVRLVVCFDHNTPVPIKNFYQTPESLGVDRLANAVAAAIEFPQSGVIVCDFGTAITIDFVSAAGEYLGGNISPGLAMRFAALHQFTKRLPLIDTQGLPQSSCRFGISTHQAIYLGVVRGICLEIEGYMDENPDKKIFFTGGDALFFEKQIKRSIFVDSKATLRGLRVILETLLCLDEQ